MKPLTDVHTHTTFSTDGQDDIFAMLRRAEELGLAYWGISEHFDYDYFADGILFSGMPPSFTDAERYFFTARRLSESSPKVTILVGAEFGFSPNARASTLYRDVLERFAPDFVVNSVHTDGRFDYCEAEAFAGKSREQTYGEYLNRVRASLDAPYPYDIVGHIGYPARWSPYEKREFLYDEFAGPIDDILTTIIRKDKILEINSSVKGLSTPFLPFPSIAGRYFALGGRKISFASDAHGVSRLAENRAACVRVLREIGFSFVTIPCRGREIIAAL